MVAKDRELAFLPALIGWARSYLSHYDLVWPQSYLCLDTETTGLDPRIDLPYEVGLVHVRDRQIVQRVRIVIDWTRSHRVAKQWLVDRITFMTERRGSQPGQMVRPILQLIERGQEPDEACQRLQKMLERCRAERFPIVGHNVLFDFAMFTGCLDKQLDVKFSPKSLLFFDTGLIEKARRLYPDADSLPKGRETVHDFHQRLRHRRMRGKWSAEHCAVQYGTDKRGVQLGKLHQADYDAWACHLLFERMREMCSHVGLPKRVRGTRVA